MYSKQLQIHQKPGTFQEVKVAFLGCLLNSTGHGLPQIVKPGYLFLNILWVIFYAVAVSVCGLLIYQAVDQYYQFDVITMTKIKRETKMKLPAITICSPYENTYTMIIECRGSSGDCKMNNLTLYNRNNHPEYCAQLNYEKNVTYEGSVYYLTLYQPKYTYLLLAITDNSARVVLDEVSVNVYAGQETDLVLSKTVQTVLGPPYSDCNQSTDYIQATCLEDCDKIALKEACGSGYDTEFQWLYQMSEKCHDAYYKLAGIVSKCNQECPVECNQVSFQLKRVDIELDIDNNTLDEFKAFDFCQICLVFV